MILKKEIKKRMIKIAKIQKKLKLKTIVLQISLNDNG